MRARAASARPASRDSKTTLASSCAKTLAMASPIPIEAPVTTTTFPASSILGLYRPRHGKSRLKPRCAATVNGRRRLLHETDPANCGLQPVSYNRTTRSVPRAPIGEFLALLPLFPLDVVLLPGAPLPLHIFEPRYKEMIGECLANDAPFGVIRALEEGLAEIGCTAEIITVTKEN